MLHGNLARWLLDQFGLLVQRGVVVFTILGLLLCSIFVVNLTQFRKFQPAPIDVQPIVNFLQKDEHWRWRYMTMGFGDQMAWLSAQTTAAQIDGNYHSARRLPEMTTTPVERLEGAKFSGIPGLGSLQQFINVPDKYNLKYIFSNDQFYDPLLFFYGWHKIQLLENGIAVWERADIPVLPEVLPRKEIPFYQRVMFGILPPLALCLSILAATAQFWRIPFLLIGEVLGLRPLFERFYNWAAGPFERLWTRMDQRLLAASTLPPSVRGRAPRWQLYIHLTLRRLRRRVRPASTTARQVRTGLLLTIILLLLVIAGLRIRAYYRDPLYQVNSYYDDLDFRRFEDAYQRLNPATRPAFDQYLLNLSVQGGLVASYAKLDSLYTTVLAADAEQMRVEVETRYITALSYYTDTQTLVLTNNADEGWRIEPATLDVRVPPDQFLRRPAVEWLSLGRRSVTTSVVDFTDLLDRPELAILSARLVTHDLGPKGIGYSLVGEVMNTDVDPADVTVSGYIYDDKDTLLTWYNAGAGMMHKLFPQEITPFRIDFQGVAGLALQDTRAPLPFSPDAAWTYVLPGDENLGRFDVFAKAVVTQRDLDRDVGIQGLRVEASALGYQLQGTMVNTGIKEAVIPHLLVTFYDAQGEVAWVDDFFLPQALRPQRTMDFAVNLTPSAAVTPLDIKSGSYSNALQLAPVQPPPRADWLGLPEGMGYSYLRVSLHYFTGVQ